MIDFFYFFGDKGKLYYAHYMIAVKLMDSMERMLIRIGHRYEYYYCHSNSIQKYYHSFNDKSI